MTILVDVWLKFPLFFYHWYSEINVILGGRQSSILKHWQKRIAPFLCSDSWRFTVKVVFHKQTKKKQKKRKTKREKNDFFAKTYFYLFNLRHLKTLPRRHVWGSIFSSFSSNTKFTFFFVHNLIFTRFKTLINKKRKTFLLTRLENNAHFKSSSC